MICVGVELKALESLLGTAVGVGFIYPVVYQHLYERSLRLVEMCKKLSQELEESGENSSMRDLARHSFVFRSFLFRVEEASSIFFILSSISALTAFSLLIASVFLKLCLSPFLVSMVVLVVSLPVFFCALMFICWWDRTRPLLWRYHYYYS